MKIRTIILAGLLPFLIGFGCKKDSTYESNAKGRIEITDAPIDDTNVRAVYVTIVAIKLDGKTVENFKPMTTDIKKLQKGKTELLTETPLELKNYSTISLVMDYDKDINGVYPGAYVLDELGNKHALFTDNNEIELEYAYSPKQNQTTTILIDFDLRKAIVRSGMSDDNFDFTNHRQLTQAFRLMEKDQTGSIVGNARNLTNNNGKVVVYAYKMGEYNPSELIPKGDQIEFSNSVASTSLGLNGDFKFEFLAPGEYQIQFAYFEKDKSGKRYILHGTYQQRALTTLPNNTIKITPNIVYNVDLFLTGLQLI